MKITTMLDGKALILNDAARRLRGLQELVSPLVVKELQLQITVIESVAEALGETRAAAA